jgi:2-keto-4-pentenoate hydratase/2-oxohepta-3-ene-1,7-dioic acid hydratase in catechol pathway
MRLSTYKEDGQVKIGFAVSDEALVAVADAYQDAGLGVSPESMLELIELPETQKPKLQRAWQVALRNPTLRRRNDTVEWLPPVQPRKILGVPINNAGAAKLASVCPDIPNFFLKPSSCLIGHKQAIVVRPEYGLTHPEAELAVVIGQRSKGLSPEHAMDAVFGFTIINDVTSVTLKSGDTFVFPAPAARGGRPQPGFEHGDLHLTYHARSKGCDTFGPCGPWIVTKDEVPNPDHVAVRVFLEGEECTTDNTANLRFGVEWVVSWASQFFTLEPGDMLHLGTSTAGKYGMRELDFQSWDGPCSIVMEGIGTLSNPILRQNRDGSPAPKGSKAGRSEWPPRHEAKVR